MTITTLKAAVATAAVALMATAATASTVSYDVTSAVGRNNDHAIWLPDGVPGGSDFDFDTAGLFSINADGSASLTGSASSQTLSGYGFEVDVSLQQTTVGTTGPKLEQGAQDTSGWSYFSLTSGLLTGTGSLLGYELRLTQAPNLDEFPFQIGDAANGKNANFGGSGWFFYEVYTECNVLCVFQGDYKGDFNVDLAVSEVPLPAAGLLLPVALGGMVAAGRRKKAKAAKA